MSRGLALSHFGMKFKLALNSSVVVGEIDGGDSINPGEERSGHSQPAIAGDSIEPGGGA
jgi:hypothetical protein